MESRPGKSKLTDETIVDLVRVSRNDLIKTFLIGLNLAEYLKLNHALENVTPVRIEFMKRSLQELLIAPVDLEHYSKLILEIRGSENSDDVLQKHQTLFVENIEASFKNYIY